MVKVSVIIACYNQGRFLDDAVNSALGQTFDDFEIIIVNDGSTDLFTLDLLDDYERPKTRVIHTANHGLPSARNNGIHEATGEYILPLDADDRIERDYITEAVKVLDENTDVGIVYCEAEYFGERKGPWILPEFDMRRMLVSNLIFCSGFFRKKDWERIGGYNTNMIYGWEDWDFWLSILELNKKVYRIPKILFYYRVTESSMIEGMSNEKQALMRLHIYDNHRDLYKNISRIEFTPLVAQLFIDTGSGFNESDSISQVISGDETEIEFDVSEFTRTEAIRFDPANDYSVLKLESVTASTKDKLQVELEELKNNAIHKMEELYLFETLDPWITLTTPKTGINKIQFKIEYIVTGRDAYAYILDNKYKIIMEQSNQIQLQRNQIEFQGNLIRKKENQIRTLEEELNRIKSLFFWRIINMMILIKKAADTTINEGPSALRRKIHNYLQRRKAASFLEIYKKDYDQWVKKHAITKEGKKRIREEIAGFTYTPKITIIMPVYNVKQLWLEKAIESVMAQLYQHWELCIADDASSEKHIKTTLEKYVKKDVRVKVKFLGKNGGISVATNEALSMATGTFVGFLDHDDKMAMDALYENVKLLNAYPDADMIYSDEDKLDINGQRCEPHFKPDWSPDMFLSHMYTCHFGVYRKSIIEDIGGFRKMYDGSQDYDLVLRIIEKTKKIYHIPKVLYHWRIIPGSAALSTNAKSYAYNSAKMALSDYMKRNNIIGRVENGPFTGSFRVKRKIEGAPEVTIIIPFRDKVSVLQTCVYSILQRTDYKNYKIFLVNNRSKKNKTTELIEKIKKNPCVKILDYNKTFNYSAINNFAVLNSKSEYVIFLNNDTEVISPGWIQAMLEYAQRKDVGCVGALLYYPDDTVQHGGVILGLGGIAGHSHAGYSRETCGYMGRLKTVNNVSAVTAACLMTKRSVFEEIGGFDENITHAFNDVDLCLKMREKGYLIVYTPYAELYHHESFSRGIDDTPKKKERFRREIEYVNMRWGKMIEAGDPYYNPNMTLTNSGFAVKF